MNNSTVKNTNFAARTLLLAVLLLLVRPASAQIQPADTIRTAGDSLMVNTGKFNIREDALQIDSTLFVDSSSKKPEESKVVLKKEPDRRRIGTKRFIPDSRKATWLALVIPGGGQIYNRKYWKLPIVYGGFVGCAYALRWNSQMYEDYKQAYLDIMDDDPNTDSFKDFLPPGYDISGNEKQFQDRFKRKKDIFRRQRDLSIFAFMGVYVLSVIDAYVDAELSDFDISDNLAIKLRPSVINTNNNLHSAHVGMSCCLKF